MAQFHKYRQSPTWENVPISQNFLFFFFIKICALDLFLLLSNVLFEYHLITGLLSEISLRVHELASASVWAVHLLLELLARTGLVVRGNLWLFLQLMVSMSKGTLVLELTFSCQLPVSAKLGLIFQLEALVVAFFLGLSIYRFLI